MVDQSVTITIQPVGDSRGAISGIRILDVARSIWFSAYPEGQVASVTPGSNNLHIIIGLKQTGGVDGNVWGSLKKTDGTVLIAPTTRFCAIGDTTQYIEYTGAMTSGPLNLIVECGH